LVAVENLGYGRGTLYLAASGYGPVVTLEKLTRQSELVRIATEYPNLAQSWALNRRLRRFSVFPLWGAAEVYPPESADLALLAGNPDNGSLNHGLVPLTEVIDFNAFLIANKGSWETKDMADILASIRDQLAVTAMGPAVAPQPPPATAAGKYAPPPVADDTVRLALPDGHQQSPTADLLRRAGIEIDDYPSAAGNRRPSINLAGVTVKVIRPQDMPLQVANGNFDLAITGRDWLWNHRYQFPSSPVTELVDLQFGRVKVVAVVSQEQPAAGGHGLKVSSPDRRSPIRVASEYVNIADKYARDHHLGPYRIIPTWGATEAFLPEDADVLIENTETGRTIARHNLKIVDTLFQSTACLIGNTDSLAVPVKGERMESITRVLRTAVEETQNANR